MVLRSPRRFMAVSGDRLTPFSRHARLSAALCALCGMRPADTQRVACDTYGKRCANRGFPDPNTHTNTTAVQLSSGGAEFSCTTHRTLLCAPQYTAVPGEDGYPSPKEQPPRKLSGPRTGMAETLRKAARSVSTVGESRNRGEALRFHARRGQCG